MKLLVTVSAFLVVAHATSPPLCELGWDCVENALCINGVIDTSGAGQFNLRYGGAGTPVQCVKEGHTCCRIPDGIPPRDVGPCFANEDCVARDQCHKGVIDTSGGGLIDLRLGLTEYRECFNADYGEEGICCRLPEAPVPVDTCPDGSICTEYNFCSVEGRIVENLHSGPYHASGTACYVNPGVSHTTGLCCSPVRIEKCFAGESCVPKDFCDLDGHKAYNSLGVANQYSGQECYIGESLDVGTCCKPPVAVEACPPGGRCVPESYCNSLGQLTREPHGLATCPDCLRCRVGQGSDQIGVCCGPPPPLPECGPGSQCTVHQYCDTDGYAVSKPLEVFYSQGQECNLPGGFGYGICCQTERPPVYCPLEAECVPQDFCVGSILEENSQDVWSGYGEQKTWHRCTLDGEPNGGVCCKNTGPTDQQCGVSYYASQNIKTRFYDPQLQKLEADFGELPWQAIVFYSNYTFKCGASLISERHLLTVAHCVNGLFPYDLRIRLGEWQVNTFDEPLQYQDLDVAAIFVHPEFRAKTVHNNIAIIELKQPVNTQYNINNVCLPSYTDVISKFPPGTRCLVSGWGKDSFSGNFQHILKKIDIPLVSHPDCQAKLRKTRLRRHFRLHKSYMCAGGEEGIDACVGDGGGPLVCYDELAQHYVQVGITAWGIGCGQKDVPAAYTDVSKFTGWINSILTQGGGEIPGGAYGK